MTRGQTRAPASPAGNAPDRAIRAGQSSPKRWSAYPVVIDPVFFTDR
jgi:hypothetical protein